MKRARWYVVQVETGREQKTCDAIERACKQVESVVGGQDPVVREVFAPSYRSRYKLHGEWHDENRPLMPGYVVAVTEKPWRFAQALRWITGFARIVRMGETLAPLSDDDRNWIERWTGEGDRAIPMSIARKEGDHIVVTEGPLKGREGMITRIKRRLCMAEVEIHAGAMTIRTTVGLAVLPG